jgi:hypothetical protein
MSLVRFLQANHSVRLMRENDRRFSLPRGPVFPQFGRAAHSAKEVLAQVMAPAGGATLRRVQRAPDILDDDYRLPAEHAGHGLGRWGEALRRVFGGAPRS